MDRGTHARAHRDGLVHIGWIHDRWGTPEFAALCGGEFGAADVEKTLIPTCFTCIVEEDKWRQDDD